MLVLALYVFERQLAVTQQLAELEKIAGLSQDEAREQLLSRLEEQLEAERGTIIRRFQEENRQKLQEDAQEIMVHAMQRYSGDCAYERTTSTIPLPNEDMKGRIIGREGRNIRTIEAATGVNVLIDDTPEAVVISCFDPVRREIARITMERLVSDGRIHPARVEEIVNKVKKEVENEIAKAGQETVQQLGITRLRPNIVNLLGRLKYRYSFSQNVLMHSIEVANMMGAIAASIGLDERKARRAGLLHDIGKISIPENIPNINPRLVSGYICENGYLLSSQNQNRLAAISRMIATTIQKLSITSFQIYDHDHCHSGRSRIASFSAT